MIITIKGADFSLANIGTLSTYIISKSIGSGAIFDIPNFVDKNSSVNWTITLDEGYTFGTYSVTMGGVEVTPTVVDNVMTISIAEVTGNVRIVVATVNENGEEDNPVVPPVTPDDSDPEIGTTKMFVNGEGLIVGNVKDMQFTIGKTIGGGGDNPNSSHSIGDVKGRAASVGYWLKVNGGETISLNQCLDGKTVYYSTVAMKSNTDICGDKSNEAFYATKWVTESLVLPTTTRYVQISLKNDDGSVDFTPEEISIIKNNFIIS